ncbi:alpha/beta hydrolase [Pseudomaricurvus alkylphenolicus]|uniref:alpha/beta hydrolase n=1 Tax=Pseudomaricurvus alkylphenolicus TaxID=1306991 RepID=UPI001421E7E6|nr:alpha/beta hydrolase fold domain-containing protein [Pseudomaricurvus alkylphenolicus]NIB44129.1 alpha/beta hydrolase [Pseudomaricurvus alkylphenolicus]
MVEFTQTPMWDSGNAYHSWKHYLLDVNEQGSDAVPATAAPARAPLEQLRGLPATYLSTMALDPLRDEGILYAYKLMQAGVPVDLRSYSGTFHACAMLTDGPRSREIKKDDMEALRRGLKLK